MKYLKSLFYLLIVNLLIACGGGDGGNNSEANEENATIESNEAEDYSNMREVDLSEYGIMASIMVPGENKGKIEMEETSFGSIILKVGDKFGLEIVPFGLSLEEAKAEFDQGGVYQIEALEEDANYILYKKSIPDAEVNDEYHCFVNADINGELYEIKSLAEMELKETQARNILKSAKSFKAKEAA